MLKDGLEVVRVFLSYILNAKVVDAKGEGYRPPVVGPEPRGEFALVVALLVEALLQEALRKEAGLGRPYMPRRILT